MDEPNLNNSIKAAPVQCLSLKRAYVVEKMQSLPQSPVREKQYDTDYKSSASHPPPVVVKSDKVAAYPTVVTHPNNNENKLNLVEEI